MGTIRLVLRADKVLKQGIAPIELIYQVKGQRKRINTKVQICPKSWDSIKQEAIYLNRKDAKRICPEIDYELLLTESQTKETNKTLEGLINQIEKIEKDFIERGIPYSVETVIEAIKEKQKVPTEIKAAPSKELYDFIDKYIVDHKATREPGSLVVYKSLKKHLQDFEQETRKRVAFAKIDYSFFQSFQNFLIDKQGLNNTTVAKQLSTVKTFLNYARKQGIEISDRYKDFKIKRESLEVIALTNEEFESLFYLDLSHNKRLSQVRDIFCFSCATGLRYSDLEQLKREHIKGDEIQLTVKKTKASLTIPLTPYSKSILDKYKGLLRPLPVISNQKLNQYLKGWEDKDKKKHKGLCEIAGIIDPIEIVRYRGAKREAITYKKYELIGVHTGRKTFATLSLEKGMSAEEVMEITGHKDYKSFKRYIRITEKRKKVVMQRAWGGQLSEIKLMAV